MARRQNSTFHNFRALKLLEDLLLTFDHKVVELTQPEFEANPSKSLGGVRSNMTCGKRQKWPLNPKWPTSCWVWPLAPRDFFVRLGMIYMCTDLRACSSNLPSGLVCRWRY